MVAEVVMESSKHQHRHSRCMSKTTTGRPVHVLDTSNRNICDIEGNDPLLNETRQTNSKQSTQGANRN